MCTDCGASIQAVEFVVQEDALFVLNSRKSRRTARAAVHIAVSMIQENVLTERQALTRIDPQQMNHFLHAAIDPRYGEVDYYTRLYCVLILTVCFCCTVDVHEPTVKELVLACGYSVSNGVVTGCIVFNSRDARYYAEKSESCVLVVSDASELCNLQALQVSMSHPFITMLTGIQ